MSNQGIAPHESIELHEILTFKNVCLTKAVTMSKLVSDEELKEILQHDAAASEVHIKELRDLMEDSPMANAAAEEDLKS